MKKTVSLILALVMALAIASTAAAITGFITPTVSNPTVPPYKNISLVVVESIGTGLSVLNLQPVPDSKLYVKDSLVHYALYFYTPRINKFTMDGFDYGDPAVLLSSDVVDFLIDTLRLSEIADGTSIVNNHGYSAAAAYYPGTKRYMEVDLPAPVAGNGWTYVLTGSAVVTGSANGVIQADFMGRRDCMKFWAMPKTIDEVKDSVAYGLTTEMPGPGGHPIFSGLDQIYNVTASGIAGPGLNVFYDVAITAGKYAGAVVQFNTDYDDTVKAGSDKNVVEVKIFDGGDVWLVKDEASNISGEGATSLTFIKAPGPVQETNPGTIARLTGIYRQVMNFFELGYIRKGVLLPQHFAYKFSTFYYVASDDVNVYAGAITIPDAAVDIPQTGDASTSIGFVMIALAILAACGVAYRKVRS